MSSEPARSVDDEAIDRFWSWVALRESALRGALAASSTADLQRLLSPRVEGLHPGLRWELGPGREEEHQLVVSPGGVRDLLPITTAIVARAPKISGWEFHAARPPKVWSSAERTFELGLPGRARSVDPTSWRYVLVGYPKGRFFDVTFVDPRMHDIAPKDREQVAWLLVDGELGERCVIEHVGAVECATSVTKDLARGLSEVRYLREHIEHKLDEWAEARR